jgi:predicted nucleic acid-binding protein
MFLADTNIVSELIRPRPHVPLVRRLLSTDALLAATAQVHDLVLVTRNIRHFQNVPGLIVVSWFSEE